MATCRKCWFRSWRITNCLGASSVLAPRMMPGSMPSPNCCSIPRPNRQPTRWERHLLKDFRRSGIAGCQPARPARCRAAGAAAGKAHRQRSWRFNRRACQRLRQRVAAHRTGEPSTECRGKPDHGRIPSSVRSQPARRRMASAPTSGTVRTDFRHGSKATVGGIGWRDSGTEPRPSVRCSRKVLSAGSLRAAGVRTAAQICHE
jgi:hypothetical protein